MKLSEITCKLVRITENESQQWKPKNNQKACWSNKGKAAKNILSAAQMCQN